MSEPFDFKMDRRQFGRIEFVSANNGAHEKALWQSLSATLGGKITQKKKGWFGPKITYLELSGQKIAFDAKGGIDLLQLDDETRETVTELLRLSSDFRRV